ncbi:serine protease [Hydrogenophaga sp.]|uniref:S1 family peptidase n=1 Tax=Hydrogenophaga sp. TaxID=1904254 RepID=UPI00271F01BA|nr:serine protease [Hydrogenophaga sp.]MDO9439086.1 serine protease [Hydrogenophaga sp.]
MLQKNLITLGLVLMAAQASAQVPLAPDALFEKVSPSIWAVRTQDSSGRALAQGSAVVVAPGRVVTSCRVLARANAVSVSRENVTYGATLEYPDPDRDLCQLRVANLNATPVAVAPADTLRAGARVYAIGSPYGLETAISDGMLSGIRRNERMDIEALLLTTPIESGSSGGGLFDAQGRLIGITVVLVKEGQSQNMAVPASWIADLPARAQAVMAVNVERSKAQPKLAAPSGDRLFEYVLMDRLTGNAQRVVYRLDRVDGDDRIYNQGTRVERAGGEVITAGTPIGGEFDLVMPPGGWVQKAPQVGSTWPLRYEASATSLPIRMELTARVAEQSTLQIANRELSVVRVQFKGYTHRVGPAGLLGSGVYEANAWYAPELGRVVRFGVKTRGGSAGTAFYVDETLDLVSIRAE